jgi:small-conductance mechanosensitive channel
MELAAAHPAIVGDERIPGLSGPVVQLVSFGQSTLDFELQAQILDAGQKGGVASDLRFQVDAAFRREKIEMPYPQRDLHIRSLPQGYAAAPQAPSSMP